MQRHNVLRDGLRCGLPTTLRATRVVVGIVFLVLGVSNANAIDMGDLNLPQDRLVEWAVPDLVDTSGWTRIDVTNPADCNGCNADPADNANDDNDDIQAAIDKAASRGGGHIIYLPHGTYNLDLDNATSAININDSNIAIQCESPESTTIVVSGVNGTPNCVLAGQRGGAICFHGGNESNAVAWTGGYSKGEKVLTLSNASAYSKGDWITVRQNDKTDTCPLIYHDGSHENPFNQFAQVTCVDGESCDGTTASSLSPGQIQIDRGLFYDYKSDSCGGEEVVKFDPIENVGIEGCNIRFVSKAEAEVGCTNLAGSYLAGCKHDGEPLVLFRRAVNGWAKGNTFGRHMNTGLGIASGGRILVEGNTFKDINSIHFNSGAFLCPAGCGQNVVENNVFKDVFVGANFQQGANGNVFAYNYSVTQFADRFTMNHGKFTRANLIEGNSSDTHYDVDSTWGPNGPYNTWYRNRSTSTAVRGGIRAFNSDKYGPIPPQMLGNWVGNNVYEIAKQLGGTVFDERLRYAWIERNIGRSAIRLQPAATTSCGTGVGDNCLGTNRSGINGPLNVTNVPDSFYRSAEPPWWCEEACTWQAESGIGAFGDDFSKPLCKIPAQIRAEGGLCTLPSGDPTSSSRLAAPILLQ